MRNHRPGGGGAATALPAAARIRCWLVSVLGCPGHTLHHMHTLLTQHAVGSCLLYTEAVTQEKAPKWVSGRVGGWVGG